MPAAPRCNPTPPRAVVPGAALWLVVGSFALACVVTVPPPPITPRPVEAASEAASESGCELQSTCGPGCFDFDLPHNQACLSRIVTRPRGGLGPVPREVVVAATDIACLVDEQCTIVQRGGCPPPRCPSVVAVGTRLPRTRDCGRRAPPEPTARCTDAPTHARCLDGRCAGVLTTLEVVF